MAPETIRVSSLAKTWIFDIDGTIAKHNGYLLDGKDSLLPGITKLFAEISANDIVILLTSRKRKYEPTTRAFLAEHNIRYDYLIFDIPYGERILVNDKKPSGLNTAIAINTERDCTCNTVFIVDEML